MEKKAYRADRVPETSELSQSMTCFLDFHLSWVISAATVTALSEADPLMIASSRDRTNCASAEYTMFPAGNGQYLPTTARSLSPTPPPWGGAQRR